MTDIANYGTLDLNDPAQVSEYEYHFYLAYAGLTDNTLVRLIWDWDDVRRRLKTRIPYSDQIIYSWRDSDDRLVVVMAVNVNPDRGFQGAVFGFTPQLTSSEFGGGRSCEILNVMTTDHHHGGALSSYYAFIRDFCYGGLVSRGFDVAYSTCTRRLLKPYLRLGAKLLEQNSVNGEERFFLLWPVRELIADNPAALGPQPPTPFRR